MRVLRTHILYICLYTPLGGIQAYILVYLIRQTSILIMFYPYRIEHDYTCLSLKTKTCMYICLRHIYCIRYEFEELAYLILLAIVYMFQSLRLEHVYVSSSSRKSIRKRFPLYPMSNYCYQLADILRACPLLINLVEVLLAIGCLRQL